MKYSKTLEVKGDIERAFELTQSYTSGMKFRTESAVKPNMLVLKRGSAWGSLTSFKVENVKTTLTISFTQKGEKLYIMCDYDVSGYGAQIFTASDKSTLESEVEGLKHHLEIAL